MTKDFGTMIDADKISRNGRVYPNEVLSKVKSEPCGDTISREHLLSEIDELMKSPWFNNGKDDDMITRYGYVERKEAVEIVRDLCVKKEPPVTPKQRWIPVSEKLPNDRDWYLGIFKEPDTGWVNLLPFICDYVGHETKATTKEHWILRGFTDIDEHIDYYFNLECVAWMPLPEPYKEGENE